jgi:hypothetical protein
MLAHALQRASGKSDIGHEEWIKACLNEEIGSNVNLLMLLKTSICGINLAIDPWGSKLITPLSTLTPLQN